MLRRVLSGCLLLVLGSGAACGGDSVSREQPDGSNEAIIERAEREALDEGAIRKSFVENLPNAEVDADTDTIGYAPPGTGEVQPEVSYAPCTISVILPSPEAVALYRDAGDDVITTRDGNAGAKVTGATEHKAACLRAADKALSGLG